MKKFPFVLCVSVVLVGLTRAAHGADESPTATATAYGIIRPTYTVASGTLGTYGRPNAVAPTMVAVPSLVSGAEELRGGWGLGQTRLGGKVRAGAASGKVEIDFVDFSQAMGTTTLRPRLRIATVGWEGERTQIVLGQTWDAFSPLGPLHKNLVGGHFMAGNQGFMRDQLIVTQALGGASVTGALGLINSNTSTGDGPIEQSPLPTGALRVSLPAGEAGSVGAAGFYGQLPLAGDEALQVWAVNGFVNLKPSKTSRVRGEAYMGQNTANAGMLTLGVGRADADIREAGGWLSLRQGLPGMWAVTVTGGGAVVLNGEDVLPGYTPGADADTPGTPGSGGVTRNLHERVGLEASPAPGLTFYGEVFSFQTELVRDDADPVSWDEGQLRVGLDVGATLSF